jgi:hypothetical protein
MTLMEAAAVYSEKLIKYLNNFLGLEAGIISIETGGRGKGKVVPVLN